MARRLLEARHGGEAFEGVAILGLPFDEVATHLHVLVCHHVLELIDTLSSDALFSQNIFELELGALGKPCFEALLELGCDRHGEP